MIPVHADMFSRLVRKKMIFISQCQLWLFFSSCDGMGCYTADLHHILFVAVWYIRRSIPCQWMFTLHFMTENSWFICEMITKYICKWQSLSLTHREYNLYGLSLKYNMLSYKCLWAIFSRYKGEAFCFIPKHFSSIFVSRPPSCITNEMKGNPLCP